MTIPFRNIILITAVGLLIIAGLVWKFSPSPKQQTASDTSSGAQSQYSEPLVRAPDGTLVQVHTISPLGEITSLDLNHTALPISMGTGTTTLNKATPFNDILIAETGSQYATLRNARYTVWPYPGEIPIKQIYIILPDVYEPIFSGYSDKQFLESMDGTKHVVIHLRHKQQAEIGPDAHIFVQSPITTDDAPHPLTLLESTNSGAVYSIVANNKEVLIEVTFSSSTSLSTELSRIAHTELLRAVTNMEIIW